VATEWQRSGPPNLLDVLAAVAPGRVVPLELTAEQKRILRDRDARLAVTGVGQDLGGGNTMATIKGGEVLDAVERRDVGDPWLQPIE
jgi:hypothetical protein